MNIIDQFKVSEARKLVKYANNNLRLAYTRYLQDVTDKEILDQILGNPVGFVIYAIQCAAGELSIAIEKHGQYDEVTAKLLYKSKAVDAHLPGWEFVVDQTIDSGIDDIEGTFEIFFRTHEDYCGGIRLTLQDFAALDETFQYSYTINPDYRFFGKRVLEVIKENQDSVIEDYINAISLEEEYIPESQFPKDYDTNPLYATLRATEGN